MIAERLLALWVELRQALVLELETRSLASWVLCFAPILVFFEVPRYYLPLLGVLIARKLGWPEEDEQAREALLRRQPLVSVVIAGLNEEETIDVAIESLLAQGWTNLEIIVVDDHSSDRMYEKAARYARRGLVRLVRNSGMRGRAGKPAGINLGLRLARGEFLLVVDADTTFDRRLIEAIVAPFADPKVGVVAGNVHVRNSDTNLLTRLQTVEYAVSIDLHKQWTDLCGCTLQGSGAITAFRTKVMQRDFGWMQELAEDTDISLRLKKAGWEVVFAPTAVAITDVPESLLALTKQRTRWDRGGLRNYFMKHWRLMLPRVAGWSFASELWAEFFYAVIATLAYPVYFVWMLWSAPMALAIVLVVASVVNVSLSLFALWVIANVCERIPSPGRLLGAAALTPFYKGYLRWVRFRATLMELVRVRYEDPYLPYSAYANAPRW